MSCCGGLNQILSLAVPGSDQTEGAALDVSGLVGSKSFDLSGTYSGAYTILGSEDGTHFVPLITFNSGAGVQAFKQTTSLVMRFVKVRRRATNLSPIAISVAGASSLTESPNNFVALATVPANQGVGPLPSVDLWTLVPSTGLDAGFAATCVGDFEGIVALEGSLDGTQFSPIGDDGTGNVGGFAVSPKIQGAPVPELSPLRVGEVVRFVRLNILPGTRVNGPVNVAIGGSLNANPGGGGGTVTLVKSTDGSVIVTGGAGPTVDLSVPAGPSSANWALGINNRRYFAVSKNGNDLLAGYSNVSPSAAGLVAKKTLAGLKAIFPATFNGRAFELIIENGDYSAEDFDALFKGMVGEDPLSVIRGTCTLPSAGSVAFAGDVTDVRQHGFINATGMNATGYNPTNATGTLLTLTKVGGGAPAFPAEPALPQGYRNRFDVATTTGALANTRRMNWKVNAGSIQFSDNAADNITTVASDVVYLEMPGVIVGPYSLESIGGLLMMGISSTGAANARNSSVSWTGCVDLTGHHTYGAYGYERAFVHPDFQGDAGMAFRDEGTLESNSCLAISANGLSTALDFIHTNPLFLEAIGCTIARDMFVRGGGQDASHKHEHDAIGNGGANGGAGPTTRFIGIGGGLGLELDGTPGITVDGISLYGAAQVRCTGTGGGLAFGQFGMSGVTASAAALSMRLAEFWRVTITNLTAMTATGATDDIELAAGGNGSSNVNSAWAPWVVLGRNDATTPRGYGVLKDCSGNHLTGTGTIANATGSAELIGEVVPLQNIANPLARQWDMVQGVDSSFRVNPASLAGVPFTVGLYVAITRAHALNDWVICAKRMLKAPLTFDAGTPTQTLVPAYLSNTHAGQATDIIPTVTTQAKYRLGPLVQSVDGNSSNAVDFDPDLFSTVSDGLR